MVECNSDVIAMIITLAASALMGLRCSILMSNKDFWNE
jgi:hypothetical protein